MHHNLKFIRLRQQSGSILLWTLGCFFISLMTIMTAISVVSVSQTQRQLQNVTDAAALAGANQISPFEFVATGNFDDLAIDATAARSRVSSLLQASGLQVSLRRFKSSGLEVAIMTSTLWKPPWVWLGLEARTLTAEAMVSVDRVAGG